MKLFTLVCAWLLCSAAVFAQALQIHPQNPAIFLYKGKPTVIIGSGEHYGAVMNLDFDYKKYLQTIGRDGLNTTRLFTGPYKEKPGAFGIKRNTMAMVGERYLSAWARSDQPGYVEGGNKFDLEKWDPAYFERLKDFMREADAHEIIVEVTLFTSFYNVMWPASPFHPANNINGTPDMPYRQVQAAENGAYWALQEAYVRKMVRELNGFGNFYFEIQNEPWADNGTLVGVWNDYIQKDLLKEPGNYWRCILEPANDASLAWQKKIAAVIRAEEEKLPQRHLISQNYGNFRLSLPAIDPNVDILNFHYALPEVVAMNRHWRRPIGCNETGFAGRNDDAYRRQAWRFLLSGGGLFGHLDYSFSVGQEDGTDVTSEAPGGGSPELRSQFRILKEFLGKSDIVHLQPDTQSIVSRGAFTWAMSDRQREWIVYCEAMQPFSLRLQLPRGTYAAEWIDTRTGVMLKKETIRNTYGSFEMKPAENFQEVALRLKRSGKG